MPIEVLVKLGVVLLLFLCKTTEVTFLSFLFIPISFLLPKTIRKVVVAGFTRTLNFYAALMELSGVRIRVTGDRLRSDEMALIISNHLTDFDWLFLVSAFSYAYEPSKRKPLKIASKSSLRHVPMVGWSMQMIATLFIRRTWQADQDRFRRYLDYILQTDRPSQLLFFPEGRVLHSFAKDRSDKYAERMGLPKLNYTLHPHTKGFVYIAKNLRERQGLDAVYEISLGYPDFVVVLFRDLIFRGFPPRIEVKLRRIPIEELPEDEELLEKWLLDVWKRKEREMERFASVKHFGENDKLLSVKTPGRNKFFCWPILSTVVIVGLIAVLVVWSPLLQLYCLVSTLHFCGHSLLGSELMDLNIWYYRHYATWTTRLCNWIGWSPASRNVNTSRK